jgi:type VI secretion system protein ImpK
MNDITLSSVTTTVNNHLASHAPKSFMSFGGANPLVAAAMPLLLFMIKLRNTQSHDNPAELRRQVIDEIRAFEVTAKNLQCSPRLILAARYCICTALDETVLLTPWGSNSVWAQQSLLSFIHKETWGGERFFIILEKMSEDPQQNLSLLELIYIILSLGFEGKYYNTEKMVRDEIRHRLFRLIIACQQEPDKQLSSKHKLLATDETVKIPFLKKWQIAAITCGILFLLAIIFNIATYFNSRKTLQELDDIAHTASVLTTPAVTQKPLTRAANFTQPRLHHSKHLKHHHKIKIRKPL